MQKLAWILLITLAVGFPAFSQDFSPGDQVRLVVRDNDIPAHPAPGDVEVAFRFADDSVAEVLAVDEATGWLRIRGESDGESATGWITDHYIAGPMNTDNGNGDPADVPQPALDWCLEKGSPDPHPSGRLRIATWNIANLHAENGESTYTGDRPSVKRQAPDYERISCYVRLFDPDILAVQEVDGEEALARVVDTDVYNIVASGRPQPAYLNGKQNTGFAYKKGLSAEVLMPYKALDISGEGDLRWGTVLKLTHEGQTINLMSVHLKSGCFENADAGSDDCETLHQQVPELEAWIDQQAAGAEPFIVLGDFNRRFNMPDDRVWLEIDDAEPANADLTTVTEDMPISCRKNEFTRFIDHIVLDRRLVAPMDQTSFRHITYRQADEPAWDRISDHCPVMVEIWLQ